MRLALADLAAIAVTAVRFIVLDALTWLGEKIEAAAADLGGEV